MKKELLSFRKELVEVLNGKSVKDWSWYLHKDALIYADRGCTAKECKYVSNLLKTDHEASYILRIMYIDFLIQELS